MDALAVEFLTDGDEVPFSTGPRHRPALRLTVVVAGAVVLLALGAGVLSVRQDRIAAGRPSAAPYHPPVCSGCGAGPSALIQTLFSEDLPGAVVIDEDTISDVSRLVPVLQSRTLKVVYGNVVITVRVQPAATAVPAHDVGILNAGYLIEFAWSGYYPPTVSQVQALATDPRLVSLRA